MVMSYDEASPYYDAIYEAMKGYAAEAERLVDLLERYAQRPLRDLLDMACGTGLHDQGEATRGGAGDVRPSPAGRTRCDRAVHRPGWEGVGGRASVL